MINSTEKITSRGVSVDLFDLYPNTNYSITIQQRSMQSSADSKILSWVGVNESLQRSDVEAWSPPLTLSFLTLPDGEFNPFTVYNLIIIFVLI